MKKTTNGKKQYIIIDLNGGTVKHFASISEMTLYMQGEVEEHGLDGVADEYYAYEVVRKLPIRVGVVVG